MSEYHSDAQPLEALHGDTVVASITISLARSGLMKIEGSITDQKFTEYMLDTARETMKGYHARRRMGEQTPVVVPPWDTALVGTPEERRLIAARDELDNAIRRGA